MANFQKIAGLHNIGEMTRRDGKRNRGRAVLAIACALMMVTAAGCGKTEEPVPVELLSEDGEDMQNDTAGNGAQGEDRNDSADAENENAADDTDGTAGEAHDDIESDDAGQKNGQDADGEGGASASQDGAQDAESDSDAQSQSVGSAELDGDVLSVSGDSFVISKRETYTDGDASVAVGVAPGYEEEEDKITVHVSEGCVWKYMTVKNGGVNPEDVSTREGSFADLKEGISTRMKGSWQGDGSFFADSIEMLIFE